jgi:hypothetical protein
MDSLKQSLKVIALLIASLLTLGLLIALAFNALTAFLVNENQQVIATYSCGEHTLSFIDHALNDAGGRRHHLIINYGQKMLAKTSYPQIGTGTFPKTNIPPDWVVRIYDTAAPSGYSGDAVNIFVNPQQFTRSDFESITACYAKKRITITTMLKTIDFYGHPHLLSRFIYGAPSEL